MSNFNDMFKPYSPEIRGDLEEYLRTHEGFGVDNLFFGPEFFFVIKDKGWMVPRLTCVRVNRSPIPDLFYLVNEEFALESSGQGRYNMSCIGAKEGVYDPEKELEGKEWSIYHLELPQDLRKIS